MMLLFALMMMMMKMKTASCVDQICRFNESESCTAALGHKLSLQLVLDAQDQDLYLYKGLKGSGLEVFRVKDNKDRKHESIRDRSEFFSYNGTLVINSVNQADSGIYRLELYTSQGIKTFERHLQIYIEVPQAAVIALGALAAVLILLLLGVIYYIYRKKKLLKTSSQLDPKRKEDEVQYGELTFSSPGVQQPRSTPQECVYATVQTR